MADETKGKKGGIMDTKVSRRTFLKHAGNALRVLGIANQLPPGMLDLLDTAKAASPIYTSNMIDFRSVVTLFSNRPPEFMTYAYDKWDTENPEIFPDTVQEFLTTDTVDVDGTVTTPYDKFKIEIRSSDTPERTEFLENANKAGVGESFNETMKYFTDNGISLERTMEIMQKINGHIGVTGEDYKPDYVGAALQNKGEGVFEMLSGKSFYTPSVSADQLLHGWYSLVEGDPKGMSITRGINETINDLTLDEIKVIGNWFQGHIDYMGTAEAMNEWNNSMKLDLDAQIESLGENVSIDAVKNAELTNIKTANRIEYLAKKYPKLIEDFGMDGGLDELLGSSYHNEDELYDMKLLRKHGVTSEDLDMLQDIHVDYLDNLKQNVYSASTGEGQTLDADLLGTNPEGDPRLQGPFWDTDSVEKFFNYNVDTKSFEPWIPDNIGGESSGGKIPWREIPDSTHNYWNNVKNYVIPANKAGIEVNDDVKLLAKPDYLNEVFKESRSSPKLFQKFGNFLWKNKLNIARNVLEKLPQEWKDQISNLPKRLLEAGKVDLKQIDEEIRNMPETIRQEVQDAKKFYLEEIRGIKEPEPKLIEPPTQEEDLLSFVPGTYTDKPLEGGQRFV